MRMMNFAVVLALCILAGSAAEYTFKQPKLPCAFRMNTTTYLGEDKTGERVVEFNGRYFWYLSNIGYGDTIYLLRPDITKGDKITGFSVSSDSVECSVVEKGLEECTRVRDDFGDNSFDWLNNKTWKNKESKTWKGKKCDHYYDDDPEGPSIYVNDGYLYGKIQEIYDLVYEYKWEAPMEDFVMSNEVYPKCVAKEKKVADVPSEKYAACEASYLKVAFVAILVALVSSLF